MVSGPGVVPVPLSGMERFGSDALLVTAIDPLAAPDTVGAKVTLRTLVAPTANVNGVDTVASENSAPETLTLETVSETVPVLLSVTVCVAESCTFTLPKLTDAGEAVTVPCGFVDTISTAA